MKFTKKEFEACTFYFKILFEILAYINYHFNPNTQRQKFLVRFFNDKIIKIKIVIGIFASR